MLVEEARALIARAPFAAAHQHWLDLGCGDGTFTRALAELLPEGSRIGAWDSDASALRALPKSHAGIAIVPRVVDFTRAELPEGLDGVLVANALHYVDRPENVVRSIASVLRTDGLLIVAEYDIDVAVPHWVPYPITAKRMAGLLARNGSTAMSELGRRASIYGRGDLYTAFARRVASSSEANQ